ncbi:M15 family metallopeptidase [Aphanothece sacrum]|uniref:D-alanyl-D-alanine carboxypeptidase n=1 Tax=Aphanothece sacrum FPU1 TaxID=1920663 RepID=A0A401IL74_APHSA|nr:M15 family metallopeptidase [Aphanothece sacrum]GBF81996.1 D-alanyl-D-alanine carboxypeptidase [Aphanothece sacrum FPU1]GBF83626.1 D-alanyl-D-alanine carboxypeptidase [Aphanothece sacrum FPU3]
MGILSVLTVGGVISAQLWQQQERQKEESRFLAEQQKQLQKIQEENARLAKELTKKQEQNQFNIPIPPQPPSPPNPPSSSTNATIVGKPGVKNIRRGPGLEHGVRHIAYRVWLFYRSNPPVPATGTTYTPFPSPPQTIASSPIVSNPPLTSPNSSLQTARTPPKLLSVHASPIPKPPQLTQTDGTPIHFLYAENSQNLVEIGTYYDRKESLNQEAAEAFKQIKLAAQKEGVAIIPISGFRSVADQKKLFERQIQRRGSKQAASRLSAPPGFSEHHTGYTLDVADGKSPDTVLKFAFDSTAAYHWLKDHAIEYGFELSFPKNNPQGVSYEPWHWRFVGSPTAKEIFREARTMVNH